jgi:hypothetical protein
LIQIKSPIGVALQNKTTGRATIADLLLPDLPTAMSKPVHGGHAMEEPLNPAASDHLPSFITAPGQTDVLMVLMGIVLALTVLMFGIVFLRLHTLPERLAHKSQKVQFEIVAILGLIALFTHMHIFWIIGLLLALIELPDFSTPLKRLVESVEKIADEKPGVGSAEVPPDTAAVVAKAAEAAAVPLQTRDAPGLGDGGATPPISSAIGQTGRRKLDHA